MKAPKLALLVSLALFPATAFAQPAENLGQFGAAPRVVPFVAAKPRPRPADATGQIRQDLTDFADTLNSDEPFPQLQKWVYGAKIGYFGANKWTGVLSDALQRIHFKLDGVEVGKIDGDAASATVTYSFTATPNGDAATRAEIERKRHETLPLRLAGDPFHFGEKVWQIVPPDVPPQSIQDAHLNDVWMAFAFRLAQNQPFADETDSLLAMMNLQQLSLGVLQFTQDFDERFAFAPNFVQEALAPYLKSLDVFFVPGQHEIYSFNANLSGKSLADIKEALHTVLFYEGTDEKPTFRYGGKAAIAFTDGHVALVSPEEAKTLIWKP